MSINIIHIDNYLYKSESKNIYRRLSYMDEKIDFAIMFKALGDTTRLKIIEMLSCGSLCACDILEAFEITQPTLSYHMKILTDSGLVKSHKEGSWIRYNNNTELIEKIRGYIDTIMTEQDNCICKEIKGEQTCA